MMTHVSFFVCLLCVALINAKSNRIVGGDVAHQGHFKYMVSLQSDERRKCGAAIIADRYVLTAAHCVINDDDEFRSSKYYVVADSTNLRSDQGVQIDVQKIYVPSRYRSNDKRYDIAVLKLQTGLGLDSNPRLQKINLPSKREPSYVGQPAVISGYGAHYVDVRINPNTGQQEEFNVKLDGKLRYAVTNIIDNEECTRQRLNYRIDENQICAQVVQREGQLRGICSGDSGGPLVAENKIIGVASKSPTGCREDNAAAIYTRVSSFIGFIEKAMKNVKTSKILVREIHGCASSSGSEGHKKSKWPFNG